MTTVLTLSHKAYLREGDARHTSSTFGVNLGNANTLLTELCMIAFGGVPNGVTPNPSTLQPWSNNKTHRTMTTKSYRAQHGLGSFRLTHVTENSQ